MSFGVESKKVTMLKSKQEENRL